MVMRRTCSSILLLFVVGFPCREASATSPLPPGARYDYEGPNLGAGGMFAGEFRGGAGSLSGAYWLEAGYNFPSDWIPLSINLGLHHRFHGDSSRDAVSVYADASGFGLSVGPLMAIRGEQVHAGMFLGVNVPVGSLRERRWRGDKSGDLAFDVFLQVRVEVIDSMGDTYMLGVMGKFRFLELYKVWPG
jgi:hypothetical protein